MRSTNNILSIQDLGVSYGSIQVLSDIDLTVQSGEIVGIVGESGSGKSTLLKAITRLLPKSAHLTSRSLYYKDTNLTTLSNKAMRSLRGSDIGFLFQDAQESLDPLFTIKRQFDEVLKAHTKLKLTKEGMLQVQKHALERVGLMDTTRILQSLPSELSGGMCQRVTIAFALALSPRILLADEPTSALDGNTQRRIVDILRTLNREEELSLLIVSHDMDFVASLAHKIFVMRDGRIVESGSCEQIMSDPQDAYTRELIDAIPRLQGTLDVIPLGESHAS